MIIKRKVCTKCMDNLPVMCYARQNAGKYGFHSICKECSKIDRKKNSALDHVKERNKLNQRQYRINNPEKVLETSRKAYKKHKEKYNLYRRNKYKNDPEHKKRIIERETRYKESGGRARSNKKPANMEKARERNKVRRNNPELHARDSIRMKEWNKNNRPKLTLLTRAYSDNLTDLYIRNMLRSQGFKLEDMNQKLIEFKRNTIKLKRMIHKNKSSALKRREIYNHKNNI